MIAPVVGGMAETERSGGQKGREWGKMNSRPALAFAAAEFCFSLREKRRLNKRCCPCPSRPYAGNDKELPNFD